MGFTPFRNAIASVTLTGSLLSFFGASFITLCYIILPMKRHFRHALILNLAIADMLNALINSIQGLYIVSKQKDLQLGAACTTGGYTTQMTVQAADCSILAISVVTLLTITRSSIFDESQASRTKEVFICLSTWVLPLITSTIVLGLKKYQPVSGNWCWIAPNPSYLRYVMTHGWRFAIIFSVIGIYAYLHFWLRKHFKNLGQYSNPNASFSEQLSSLRTQEDKFLGQSGDESVTKTYKGDVQRLAYVDTPTQETHADTAATADAAGLSRSRSIRVGVKTSVQTSVDNARVSQAPPPAIHTIISGHDEKLNELTLNPFAHRRMDEEDDDDVFGDERRAPNSFAMQQTLALSVQSTPLPNKDNKRLSHSRIQKILLLNAYPAAYIILWIPGILNRLVEASGNKSKVLQIMQASTQFIGLANAMTYGWNERIASQLKKKFRRDSSPSPV